MLKKLFMAGVLTTSLLASQMSVPAKWYVNDLLYQNDFEDGTFTPWQVVETIPAKTEFSVSEGKLKIKIVNKGRERWDITLRHRGLTIEQGHKYNVKFSVTSSKDCSIYAKIGDQSDPYTEDWNYNNRSYAMIPLKSGVEKSISESFISNRTADRCEFAFHLGDTTVPVGTVFEFDNIFINDPQYVKPSPTPVPYARKIAVNNLGYFVDAQKKATLPCKSTLPVNWTLENRSKEIVSSGKTIVFGPDEASGETVHIIDFSNFNKPGEDYILRAFFENENKEESYPFNINNDNYNKMKYDALKYFYHNRSGINIKTPYVDKSEWARLAGHPYDIATAVSERGYSANHKLDVTGGWYGPLYEKQVLEGALSAWTLMNMYERAYHNYQNLNIKSSEILKDGNMNIPESGNDIPDILDEARYEMDFLLKMQIPAGLPKAGMVHHKVKSETYMIIGMGPHEDEEIRILKMPSTSATLHFAATAAQSSRIFNKIDPLFAQKCLTAAQIAWNAALQNPQMLHIDHELIGNRPQEVDLEDEFYWAAAELFISSGEIEYLKYIQNSKHFLQMPYDVTYSTGWFNSDNTQGLGTLSLALLDNGLSTEDKNTAKDNILKACDYFLNIQKQGYGSPIALSNLIDSSTGIGYNSTGYPQRSNSYIINQCILLLYSYDFSKDPKYLNGAREAMDYLLGRNPLSKSYITGYGENCTENPFHLFFANQADPRYPKCPPGFLVSGPNSLLEDPWVKPLTYSENKVPPPQKCYIDHVESWSTNEVAIDLNAALAWVTFYLDEANNNKLVTSNKGDLNMDGVINSIDCVLLKRIILGFYINSTPDNKTLDIYNNADTNNDGLINSIDYALLKRHVLNFINLETLSKN